MGQHAVLSPVNRRRLFAFISAAAIAAAAAAGAVLHGVGGSRSAVCPGFSAQFDATDPGALVIRVCGMIQLPIALPDVALQYELQVRLRLSQDLAR